MLFDKKSLGIIGIMLLAFWLSFIFVDGLFSSKITEGSRTVSPVQTNDVNPDSIAGQLEIKDVPLEETHSAASLETVLPEGSGAADVAVQSSLMEDIAVLKFLYDKNADKKLLPLLIQRLAGAYQFADANRYLKLLMQEASYEKQLDVHVILYVLFHADDISTTPSASTQRLLPLIEQYQKEGLLTTDDVSFYRGLLSIWLQKYADATASRSSLSANPQYSPIVLAYGKALQEYSGMNNVPAYYRDALVALSMLKNGYFSLAKTLALSAMMKNADYILPYQILAYANFLSSNREVAAEYFLKLADFDSIHASRYTFLVGVAHYWAEKYEQSLLYLRQVSDTGMLTDVYRYELLSSLAIEDTDGAIRVWQKLLGQSDIQDADFMQFFTAVFYHPYVNAQPFVVYHDIPELVGLYQEACSRLVTSRDVCVYGEVGQGLSTLNWAGIANKLLYLSSTYHQSYLSHVVGDYYFAHKQYSSAKDAYSKALSTVSSAQEFTLLQAKLQKVLDAE